MKNIFMCGMDRTCKLIHIIIMALFIPVFFYVFYNNYSYIYSNTTLIMSFLSGYMILFLLRHSTSSVKKLHYISPWLEMALVSSAVYLDRSANSLGLFMILTIDIIIDYDEKFSILYLIVGYMVYFWLYYNKTFIFNTSDLVIIFIIGALQYTLTNSVGFFLKKFMTVNEKLLKTTAELNSKIIEAEETAAIKERNRIAGEIHDRVGHGLTTAVIQLEAAKIVQKSNPEKLDEHLDMIKGQVRESLDEIRKSVHSVNDDSIYINVNENLEKKFSYINEHTGLMLRWDIPELDSLKLPLKRFIYLSLMELISNAVRHGRCKKIDIDLKNDRNLMLSVTNDGHVPDAIDWGFGLNNIRDGLEEFGGHMEISTSSNLFKVEINI
ncbi:Signal transduction histidine kinase [Dethiosulfatibacter aminovorans DSM 17477]|uniref:histidine kinase n=1 Tax=Dethiosulfatibacter aminovorans DSM 17477 TaxID=1121476 RepID=A0A1M6I1M1_9FIRM|nr:histidine kinase [Dethiosulfatibacter aminovorans]SHJ28347.1 Signal transduction histidine kinase [Dethiosulfatibacter aminovorans DSM 17477]